MKLNPVSCFNFHNAYVLFIFSNQAQRARPVPHLPGSQLSKLPLSVRPQWEAALPPLPRLPQFHHPRLPPPLKLWPLSATVQTNHTIATSAKDGSDGNVTLSCIKGCTHETPSSDVTGVTRRLIILNLSGNT